MKKNRNRLIRLLTAVLLFSLCTARAVPGFDTDLFLSASEALYDLSVGDYDGVVTCLPFSDLPPDIDEWRSFSRESLRTLKDSRVQTDFQVAYWYASHWRVAVPLHSPAEDDTEVFVLISEDGEVFSGYACARWGDIQKDIGFSDHVIRSTDLLPGSASVESY